jgi:hypothetical protein
MEPFPTPYLNLVVTSAAAKNLSLCPLFIYSCFVSNRPITTCRTRVFIRVVVVCTVLGLYLREKLNSESNPQIFSEIDNKIIYNSHNQEAVNKSAV